MSVSPVTVVREKVVQSDAEIVRTVKEYSDGTFKECQRVCTKMFRQPFGMSTTCIEWMETCRKIATFSTIQNVSNK